MYTYAYINIYIYLNIYIHIYIYRDKYLPQILANLLVNQRVANLGAIRASIVCAADNDNGNGGKITRKNEDEPKRTKKNRYNH